MIYAMVRKSLYLLMFSVFFSAGCVPQALRDGSEIIIGSKKFTENVILGEIANQLIRTMDCPSTHRRELGGTRVLWNALVKGDIDMYPEYTGTLMREIFFHAGLRDLKTLEDELAEQGIRMSRPWASTIRMRWE